MCESLNLKLSHPAFATRYFMCESFWLLSRWISCTPSKLTSGNVGKRENTRTWLLLSEVTTWSSKIKAAPLSNSCSYCLLTVEYCIVFAMKDIPQLYSSVVLRRINWGCNKIRTAQIFFSLALLTLYVLYRVSALWKKAVVWLKATKNHIMPSYMRLPKIRPARTVSNRANWHATHL